MIKRKRIRKRCATCGYIGMVKATQRHCYRRKFGKGSFSCWGDLSAVAAEVRTPKPKPSPQEDAERKLAVARKNVSQRTAALKRLTTSLRFWQRKVTYYTMRASLTDAELEQMKVDREGRKRKRSEARIKRVIQLGGGKI